MKQREVTLAKADKHKENCCGGCCWFYGEDTDGYGLCPMSLMESKRCDEPCTNEEFVSREEMRHHMAVLLQLSRHYEAPISYLSPWYEDKDRAVKFAYKYMKVFSNL